MQRTTGKPEPAELPRDRQLEWAREIALRKLEQRAHTRSELRHELLKRSCPEDVADELLNSFEAVGLVNDSQFAADWVSSRHGRRNLSKMVVADELRRKGVSDDVIAEATAVVDRESELRAAFAVAESKMRSLAGMEYAVAYRRLAGALGRKGYGASVVAEVVKKTLRPTSA